MIDSPVCSNGVPPFPPFPLPSRYHIRALPLPRPSPTVVTTPVLYLRPNRPFPTFATSRENAPRTSLFPSPPPPSQPDCPLGQRDNPMIGKHYGVGMVRGRRVRMNMPEKQRKPLKLSSIAHDGGRAARQLLPLAYHRGREPRAFREGCPRNNLIIIR